MEIICVTGSIWISKCYQSRLSMGETALRLAKHSPTRSAAARSLSPRLPGSPGHGRPGGLPVSGGPQA